MGKAALLPSPSPSPQRGQRCLRGAQLPPQPHLPPNRGGIIGCQLRIAARKLSASFPRQLHHSQHIPWPHHVGAEQDSASLRPGGRGNTTSREPRGSSQRGQGKGDQASGWKYFPPPTAKGQAGTAPSTGGGNQRSPALLRPLLQRHMMFQRRCCHGNYLFLADVNVSKPG